MRVAFTDVNGIRTRYFYEGSGPTLVLIHGLGISADSWTRNIDALAEHFTVYAPDMIGHGFTGFAGLDGGAPHPKMTEHIVKLIDQLGVDRFHVCGHSHGGTIAALVYFDRPDKVDKMVINAARRMFLPPERSTEGFGNSYKNATSALRDPTLETCRNRLANVCYDASGVPEEMMLAQLTSYAQPYILPAYEEIAKANMDAELTLPYRCSDRIEQIAVPTLIIAGANDARSPIEDFHAGVKRLQNGELVIFDKCGHMPNTEHPEKFNKTVIDFLTR